MMKKTIWSTLAIVVVTWLPGCAFQRSSTPAGPSAVGDNSLIGGSSASLLGMWQSQDRVLALPNSNTCGNFQYQIASQTSTSIAGTFTATCGGGVTVSASATGQLQGDQVLITLTGNANLPGMPSCSFSVSGTGTIEDDGNTLRIPYTGTTCFGPVSGTELLHRPQPAPPPAPAPEPEPAPAPAPAPAPVPIAPVDAIDLRTAIITGNSASDVAYWPVTAKITGLDFIANGVRVDFTKKNGPGRWPDVVPPGWDGPLQYTLWMVVNIGGRWYTSGGIEYWYGLEYSGGPPSRFAYNWYYNPQMWGPLANHQPAPGELTGFFVTAGDERVKDYTLVRERSNVVAVPFPGGSGFFPFSILK